MGRSSRMARQHVTAVGATEFPGRFRMTREGQKQVTASIDEKIADELDVAERQVHAAVELLDGGSTVPFIARYRKEITGSLDDTQLRKLEERLRYLRELEDRRSTIRNSIDEQGKLTDELRPASTPRRPRHVWRTSTYRTSRSAAPRARSLVKPDWNRSPTNFSGTRPRSRTRRPHSTSTQRPRSRMPVPRWRAPGRSRWNGSPRTRTRSGSSAE